MDPGHWLSLFSMCLLGAMSPGPSLAVVVGNALHGGRAAGIACAVAHGAGVGLYGLLTVVGLAAIIAHTPRLFTTVQLCGAAYLLYLGVRSLRGDSGPTLTVDGATAPDRRPLVDGFLIAFLNPKLAVFMLALFSQFLRPGDGVFEKAVMVATVGITDASWYCLVVLLVTHRLFLERLKSAASTIDRVFGVILILLAVTVIVRAVI
jgi:threonine/homoserine/homoserine lactone efflux protein